MLFCHLKLNTNININRELILYIGKYYEYSRKFNEKIPFWNHSRKINVREEIGDKESLSGPPDYRYLTPKINKIDADETDDWTAIDYFIDTFLFVISVLIGYVLMLVFMTYNIALCICVLVGYALGRLVFYRKVRSLQRFVRSHSKKQHRIASVQSSESQSEDYAQQSHDHCNLGH